MTWLSWSTWYPLNASDTAYCRSPTNLWFPKCLSIRPRAPKRWRYARRAAAAHCCENHGLRPGPVWRLKLISPLRTFHGETNHAAPEFEMIKYRASNLSFEGLGNWRKITRYFGDHKLWLDFFEASAYLRQASSMLSQSPLRSPWHSWVKNIVWHSYTQYPHDCSTQKFFNMIPEKWCLEDYFPF